nr:RHS repeat-associated core domain-containing protein [Cruoricaptor ignavus]
MYHYHCNHLGTPQELSDDKGDIVWLSYDRAWGGSFDTIYKPQFIDNFAITENELQPIKFQGQSLDTETGLHYNRFRYYDSDVGMFISRDPIELLGGYNVFQYAPNPIGWIDPWGLSAKGGGSYGLTRSQSIGGEVNHMPAHNSIKSGGSAISHYSAPSTWMERVDHLKTASWGSATTSKGWRTVQADLISRGKFGKAMEMDIRDVQRKMAQNITLG